MMDPADEGGRTDEHDQPGELSAGRRSRRRSRGALAWLAIITVIGVVQLLRRQWGDAVIFGLAAALLGAEAFGLLAVGERLRRPGIPAVLTAAAAAAIVLSLAPRHTAVAGAAMVAVGIGAVLAAWPPPRALGPAPQRWPRALRGLAWAWASVWIVACLWELLQVTLGGSVPGGRAAYPALSDLLDPLVTPPVGQTVFVCVWLAIGLFLITRGGRR